MNLYDDVVSLISKPPLDRTVEECVELLSWFRSKTERIFRNLKQETIIDVIRNCSFERKKRDEVIIKQGEKGDRLFIILKGQLSVYVIHDNDEMGEVLQHVETVCSMPELDRTQLGQHRHTSVRGQAVGEIALIKKDCVRTASVVADENTDLASISKSLYDRSIKETLEREYYEKREFVETNPIFMELPYKYRRQLVISLHKENYQYGNILTKQGQAVNKIYFVLQGEVEVTMNTAVLKHQYRSVHDEILSLLPQLHSRKNRFVHGSQNEKIRSIRQQMCLLGVNEHIGLLEVSLGLGTYIETNTASRNSHLMILEKRYQDLLFGRRQPAATGWRNLVSFRLCLYAHRCLNEDGRTLMKFLLLRVHEDELLQRLRQRNAREALKAVERDKETVRSSKTTSGQHGGIPESRLQRADRPGVVSFDCLWQDRNLEAMILDRVERELYDWRAKNASGFSMEPTKRCAGSKVTAKHPVS